MEIETYFVKKTYWFGGLKVMLFQHYPFSRTRVRLWLNATLRTAYSLLTLCTEPSRQQTIPTSGHPFLPFLLRKIKYSIALFNYLYQTMQLVIWRQLFHTFLLDIDQNLPFYKVNHACFIVTMNFMACALRNYFPKRSSTTKEIKRGTWCRISCGKHFWCYKGICSFCVMDPIPVYELGSFLADLIARLTTCHPYIVIVWRTSIAATCH